MDLEVLYSFGYKTGYRGYILWYTVGNPMSVWNIASHCLLSIFTLLKAPALGAKKCALKHEAVWKWIRIAALKIYHFKEIYYWLYGHKLHVSWHVSIKQNWQTNSPDDNSEYCNPLKDMKANWRIGWLTTIVLFVIEFLWWLSFSKYQGANEI